LKITGIGCGGFILLIILIAVLGIALSGPEVETGEEIAQDQEEQQQEQPEGDAQPEEEPEEAVASIGEEVTVGDVSYTVNSAQPVSELEDPSGFQEPLSGNFVLVSFTFANNGSEPVTVSDIGLYLYDSQERQFETDSDAVMYLPEETSIFLLDRVNPGLEQEVQAVYAVPPDAEGFELEVSSGFFASESKRIDLGF
jgi:hypothetical protein